MLGPALTIARNTFVESVRQPVFFVIIVLGAIAQVFNTWITAFSMGYQRVAGEVTGDNKLLYDISLATVFGLGILLAAFIATNVIGREIENKTVLTVVSKPVGRTTVVIGKYLGVASAMLVAIALMTIFMLIAIRHGVLTTAADDPDQPVIIFSLLAMALAVLAAAVGNYMYGWSFPQTFTMLLLPLAVAAYLGVLLVGKDWQPQPIGTDFKPQIALTCVAIGTGLLVMTAVAVAASTRLGQVMTITVSLGIFLLGLLSNYFVGRHVFSNEQVGVVNSAESATGISLWEFHVAETLDLAAQRAGLTTEAFLGQDLDVRDFVRFEELAEMGPIDSEPYRDAALMSAGSAYRVSLDSQATAELPIGTPVYYGPAPNGVGLAVRPFDPPASFERDGRNQVETPTPSLVIESVDGLELVVRQSGPRPIEVLRPPVPGDRIFVRPTSINPAALALWTAIPNLHTFYLVDAITQARPVPLSHIGLVVLYAFAQTTAALAIAVILFQGRDVG